MTLIEIRQERAIADALAHQCAYIGKARADGYTVEAVFDDRHLLVRPGTCMMRAFEAFDVDEGLVVGLDGRGS